jgi:hypothetical protein
MLALELVRDEMERSVPVRRMPRLMVPELTRRGASSRASSWSETRRKQLNFMARIIMSWCCGLVDFQSINWEGLNLRGSRWSNSGVSTMRRVI